MKRQVLCGLLAAASLSLPAQAAQEQHLQPFAAGNEAAAQKFLQGGDVGIVQQLVQES